MAEHHEYMRQEVTHRVISDEIYMFTGIFLLLDALAIALAIYLRVEHRWIYGLLATVAIISAVMMVPGTAERHKCTRSQILVFIASLATIGMFIHAYLL